MEKVASFICKKRKTILLVSFIMLVLSIIGYKLTKVNYDILIYLPKNIETIKGQNILTDDFNVGSYSLIVLNDTNSNEILNIEKKISLVESVNNVFSIYDVFGTSIPIDFLPEDLRNRVHSDQSDLLIVTFSGSTSSEDTINAVKEIRRITNNSAIQGGMSSMVLDTMELSDKEVTVYVIIAVLLCVVILEMFLDSYIVAFLLLANIGLAIIFNLGTNIFMGEISYITKALVAVLQLGVTTDFSIFLYNSYKAKLKEETNKEKAMTNAIKDTFTSVIGSSLTTIAGFLVLCSMKLTLGRDLGIVMAKGVVLGVICVLTLFPSLILTFDNLINKTKHKEIKLNFDWLYKKIIKNYRVIFAIFIILIVPLYLAYSKVEVYYKLDKSLPKTLESIKANEFLKNNYNIVTPELILVNKDIKTDDLNKLTSELSSVEGMDFVLSFASVKSLGITEQMLDKNLTSIFENDEYQLIIANSLYDVATDELNDQTDIVKEVVKKYDNNAIVAGEGPLMKDLVEISNTDFKNVNYGSIISIFIILFIVLKSFSLPFLLISAIEFAIFANMGISYFGGTVLPFIAPIVLGTIQLGATIDYAILLTTNYIARRNDGIKKREAMLQTLNYCGTSIMISGMCFFAATCGVGIYSKIEMIGSICTLISRGAIISMISVLFILPSILLIFDGLILKTNFKNRKEVNNEK